MALYKVYALVPELVIEADSIEGARARLVEWTNLGRYPEERSEGNWELESEGIYRLDVAAFNSDLQWIRKVDEADPSLDYVDENYIVEQQEMSLLDACRRALARDDLSTQSVARILTALHSLRSSERLLND